MNDGAPKGLPNDAPVLLIVGELKCLEITVFAVFTVFTVSGAPGSKKSEYCERIVKRYDGFVHLSMGKLLREKAQKSPDDQKWKKIIQTMERGEHLPTVSQ